MRVTFIAITIILTAFRVQSQLAGFNFVPIEFDEVEPVWSHVTSDSTIIGYVSAENPIVEFDGYSHLESSVTLIAEDAIYKATRSRQNNDVAGAVMEKLNIETGELIWKKVIDIRTEDRIEYVMNLRLKGDSLIVYSIYLDEDFKMISTVYGFAFGHLSVRAHDVMTGEILNSTVPDTTISDLVLLKTPFLSDSELHFIDDDKIQVLRLAADSAGYFMVIDTMTMNGVKSNPTDILSQELELNWSDAIVQRANKFDKDTYTGDIYFLNYYNPRSQSPEHRSAQLLRYGKNGREELSFDFEEFDDLVALALVKITEAHLIVLAYMSDNTAKILLLNKETGLIERAISDPEINAASLTSQDYYLDEDGEILLMSSRRDGTDYYLDFLLSEEERFVLKKSLRMSSAGYRAVGSGIYGLDGGGFFIDFFYYEAGAADIFSQGRFTGMMRLTSEDLGLSTSVEDLLESSNSTFSFYPNPTRGTLTLISEKSETFGIVVYDFLGREVLAKDNLVNYSNLDVSDLFPGNYLIQFVTEKGTLSEHLILR